MGVFQDRLKQTMDEKQIKAITLAKATGYSAAAISKYLSNENKQPTFMAVLKIAQYLDVSAEWLGGLSDERQSFNKPKLTAIYEELSEAGKKAVYDYTAYIHEKEKNGE